MIVAPAAAPVTRPPEGVTDATLVVPLLQVPVPVLLVSVAVPLAQMATLPPAMAAGSGSTVTVAVRAQPVGSV